MVTSLFCCVYTCNIHNNYIYCCCISFESNSLNSNKIQQSFCYFRHSYLRNPWINYRLSDLDQWLYDFSKLLGDNNIIKMCCNTTKKFGRSAVVPRFPLKLLMMDETLFCASLDFSNALHPCMHACMRTVLK